MGTMQFTVNHNQLQRASKGVQLCEQHMPEGSGDATWERDSLTEFFSNWGEAEHVCWKILSAWKHK